jgi:tRNA threonylcarbamoyl adenosine modification protein YjeE
LRCRFPEPEATHRAGLALARAVDGEGVVLLLAGPLGAGKTTFVKGLAAGFGVDPNAVTSPTFGIAHEHLTPDGRALRHVDFYRLEREAELAEAGIVDFLAPGALVAVEWGDRFPNALPTDRLELRLERPRGEASVRSARAAAGGETSERLLARWHEQLVADLEIEVEPAVWP